MSGKEEKKKQFKTLITFHSPEVYERAVAEPNTSALGEALFARHFGIEIEGDTVQAKQRVEALAGMVASGDRGGLQPVNSAAPVLPEANDEPDETEGDLGEPLELPDIPASLSAETAPIVPSKPRVDDIIPDRPIDQPLTPPAGAFTPIAGPATPSPEAAQTDTVTEPSILAPDEPPAPAPVEPAPVLHPVGARLCPTCGDDMGSDPYCLNCV